MTKLQNSENVKNGSDKQSINSDEQFLNTDESVKKEYETTEPAKEEAEVSNKLHKRLRGNKKAKVVVIPAMEDEDFESLLTLASALCEDGVLSNDDIDLISKNIIKIQDEKNVRLTSKQDNTLCRHLEKLSSKKADEKKLPLALRIFGLLTFIADIILIPTALGILDSCWGIFTSGQFKELGTVSTILIFVLLILLLAGIVVGAILGIKLLHNKRATAAILCNIMILLLIVGFIGDLMLQGVSLVLLFYIFVSFFFVVLGVYLNPALRQERKLRARLRKIDTRGRAYSKTLGLDLDGSGYIKLDFFNLFWIFMIGCLLGCFIEVLFHYFIEVPGEWQNRTGMLFGPFSPIYGIGAVLMTIALNRFRNAHVLIIFAVCTVIGGAFEYFVSWWMEISFGAIAWDYSDKFLGDIFGGRTCLLFASMFGFLGLVWIKWLLPIFLKLINLIPWKVRYIVTAICALFMLINALMTIQALDCWYLRLAGNPIETPPQEFYATYFNNEWMSNHFQSMSIHPDMAARS